jgi:hypothetical protein
MSQPGIGAMLHYLGGGSKHSAEEYYGRTICGAEIVDNRLRLTLDGAKKIDIWDDGQSCCETRYMTTDDDLSSLVGHKLTRIEVKPGPDAEGEYGECHEQVFVEVGTDKGSVTIANHNEHNGYYGGFGLTITEEGESRYS